MNWRVLVRIYTMIAAVSAISLFVFAQQFTSTLFSIAVVAVATVALVSVILGAIVATRSSLDAESSTRE